MSEFFEAHPMLLFGLEALIALCLLVFIVVWTMGTAKKNPRPSRAPADHPSRRDQGAASAATGADTTGQPAQKQDSPPAP